MHSATNRPSNMVRVQRIASHAKTNSDQLARARDCPWGNPGRLRNIQTLEGLDMVLRREREQRPPDRHFNTKNRIDSAFPRCRQTGKGLRRCWPANLPSSLPHTCERLTAGTCLGTIDRVPRSPLLPLGQADHRRHPAKEERPS